MIGVVYKCACMVEEATVDVAERREDQPVEDWVDRTAANALAADHAKRSPLCRRTITEYVKIPYYEEGSQGIGFKATRQ